jgi:meiotically up-regulated gene 157 (Mug157) protein
MLQVDGRGNSLLDFDDPNLPSLLAMPLLGFDDYDTEVSTALELRSHRICVTCCVEMPH